MSDVRPVGRGDGLPARPDLPDEGGSRGRADERLDGLPLGRLPGDIHIEGANGSFYFPVTSSILVSVVLTLILNLIARLLKK